MAENELPIEITIPPEPSDADREAVLRPLLAYNQASGGASKYEPVAIMLRDTISGDSLGGLWGKLYYDWLFVELLFVPEHLRDADYGSSLLSRAEDLARHKGCVGIWLDTHSFQAPAFYLKQGYETFGVLDDYPRGAKRFFFRKLLDGAPSL
jgi:GNAT superfamily N-acetyltransferase